MKVLAVRELKERIDEILHLVEEGETVEVVDRGKVVVRLVPGNQPEQAEKQDLEAFWTNMDRLTAEISSRLPDEPIDAVKIVREGRLELSEPFHHSSAWANLERIAAEIGEHWRDGVSAVDAVRDVRREL
jgi:antitoxin (DNA-binding transcriptional repressor) of toxin-antitoxin stability system